MASSLGTSLAQGSSDASAEGETHPRIFRSQVFGTNVLLEYDKVNDMGASTRELSEVQPLQVFRKLHATTDAQCAFFFDLLVFLATGGFRDGLREEREELLERLVDAVADDVEVTRCKTTIWQTNGLLDLPTVLSKKGRIRKMTRECKDGCALRYQQGPAAQLDEGCAGWRHFVEEKGDTQQGMPLYMGRVVRLHVLRLKQICEHRHHPPLLRWGVGCGRGHDLVQLLVPSHRLQYVGASAG